MNTTDDMTLMEGNVRMEKRPKIDRWWARVRISAGNWKYISTGEKDLSKAKKVAIEKYMEVLYRAKNNLAPDTRRFSDVAQHTITEMENDLAGSKKNKHYIGAIKSYHIEFLGSFMIDNINHSILLDFDEWRIKKIGRIPNRSTINNHNAALNRVFQTALQRQWILEYQIPKLPNNGVKTKKRPSFTLDEYRKLFTFMRAWSNTGRKEKTRMIREILRDKVLILANTGIREGTEINGLRWKDVRIEKDNGYEFYVFHVDGKTGPRDCVGNPSVKKYLERIKARNKLVDDDDLVFLCRDGSKVADWHGAFEKLLIEAKLLKDREGNNRTLYSLRHMFATFKILYQKIDLHFLAEQMGTSIKMLEDHYSDLNPVKGARYIIGKRMLKWKY